jgi:hypothetical protein
LRGVFRKRGVAETAPCHGKHTAFVAFNKFAVTFRIAAANGGHGGFVLLGAWIYAVGHFNRHHLTARQQQREIVTCQIVRLDPQVGSTFPRLSFSTEPAMLSAL